MGVAEGVDRDAAEQVQVFLAVGVPDEAAGAADQHPLRGAEDAQQRGGVAGQPLRARLASAMGARVWSGTGAVARSPVGCA